MTRWRAGAIACDHCATDRRRSETFIVRADGSDPAVPAGTYRQVGRQCLADFLGGKSPAAIISTIGWPAIVRGFADEDNSGSSGGYDPVFNPTAFLGWTAAVCRILGYVTRKTAEETDCRTTGSLVVYLMTQQFGQGRAEWDRLRAMYLPTDADVAHAKAALAWAIGLTPASDYESSIALVVRQTEIEGKHAGYLASVIPAHARAIGNRVAQQSGGMVSTHQGAIKDKIEVEITVERVATTRTDFGPRHINTLRHASGACYVWKTGTVALTAGDVLMIAGTIKAHGEYRGELQTELTRCKVMSVIRYAPWHAVRLPESSPD
jgi:hypothetical protein